MKTFFGFLILAVYLVWYGTFESIQLPFKVDTSIHYIRIQNWLEAIKNLDLFRSWHPGPYFGYPEDFNYLFIYFPLALLGLIFSVGWSIKLFFLFSFIWAGYGAKKIIKDFSDSDYQATLGGLLYMGSASFVNFSLGAGSVTRMAGYAFFPWVLCSVISWLNDPSPKTRMKAILFFYASYLFHPICSVCVIVSVLIYVLICKKFLWKEVLIFGGLLLPLFSWQLGNLLIAKSYISWTIVYEFYRQFLLPVSMVSFLGVWSGSEERMQIFYFGALPLILTFASVCWRKRQLVFSLCLALTSIGIILAGRYLFGINTYRIDMIYCLGTALGSSYVLARINKPTLGLALTLLIILEQTWYARPFGGVSYLDLNHIKYLKTTIDPKVPKTFLGSNWPWFATSHEVPWISENYGLNSEGMLELSPSNLGILPYVRELQTHDLLFKHLGINPTSRYLVSEKFLFIEAPSQADSFKAVYRRLLGLKDFDPTKMPFLYRWGKSVQIVSSNGKFNLKPTDRDWQKQVIAFFQDNQVSDLAEAKVDRGKLLIIKEPFHPRLVNEDAYMVEPGLIGHLETPVSIEAPRFLWWEILLGLISLVTMLSYLYILYRFRIRLNVREKV